MGRFNDTTGTVLAPAGELRPGETRTLTAKDAQGNIVKTMILHRTNRPYVYDLCDTYNEHMSDDARKRGLMWEVLPSGELKLGFPRQFTEGLTDTLKAQRETERQRWLRNRRGEA